MGALTTMKGFVLVSIAFALTNTYGMLEVIVVSAVPNVQDLPFPRPIILYLYTFKGMETSFNCFSAMVLLFGAVGRIKPALTVFLCWNIFSTLACLPINITLFHIKTGDEQLQLMRRKSIIRNQTTTTAPPDTFDLTSIARFFSQVATVEYFYVRLGITVAATLAKLYVLYEYVGFYRSIQPLPYSYALPE